MHLKPATPLALGAYSNGEAREVDTGMGKAQDIVCRNAIPPKIWGGCDTIRRSAKVCSNELTRG